MGYKDLNERLKFISVLQGFYEQVKVTGTDIAEEETRQNKALIK